MNFKKGDIVRVKPWKRMAEDERVHIDGSGDIVEKGFPYSFTRQMERFCKCTAKVQLVSESGDIYLIFEGEGFGPGYRFREWMIEPAEGDKPDHINVIMLHHKKEEGNGH